VIVVFTIANLVPVVTKTLTSVSVRAPWPGLDGNVLTTSGKAISSTVYPFNWLAAPGTLLLLCAIITALVYRVPVRTVLG
jgi:lactate permease